MNRLRRGWLISSISVAVRVTYFRWILIAGLLASLAYAATYLQQYAYIQDLIHQYHGLAVSPSDAEIVHRLAPELVSLVPATVLDQVAIGLVGNALVPLVFIFLGVSFGNLDRSVSIDNVRIATDGLWRYWSSAVGTLIATCLVLLIAISTASLIASFTAIFSLSSELPDIGAIASATQPAGVTTNAGLCALAIFAFIAAGYAVGAIIRPVLVGYVVGAVGYLAQASLISSSVVPPVWIPLAWFRSLVVSTTWQEPNAGVIQVAEPSGLDGSMWIIACCIGFASICVLATPIRIWGSRR